MQSYCLFFFLREGVLVFVFVCLLFVIVYLFYGTWDWPVIDGHGTQVLQGN